MTLTTNNTAFCWNNLGLEATGAVRGVANTSGCIATPTAAGAFDQRGGILRSSKAVCLDELHSEVAEEVNTSCQSIAVNAHEI
mmetsp:Transcript_7747/g.13996  ORF Transcript_7747/g.13996 Transcript_7747/m.13996 type:complete len:83 (-) Transcript_7747:1210-1458(-)